jgi:hypothetical protein
MWQLLKRMLAWNSRPSPQPPAAEPAEPGKWYGTYNADWHQWHPGAWKRGESRPGHWCRNHDGDRVWRSPTLDWDMQWFAVHGMAQPRHIAGFDGRVKPGEFRFAETLGPGESISIPIVVDKEARA